MPEKRLHPLLRGDWPDLNSMSYTEKEYIGVAIERKRERKAREKERERKKRQKALIKRAKTYKPPKPKPKPPRLNRQRGERGGEVCIRGHRYTPENTYIRKRGPQVGCRQCKACKALRKGWAKERQMAPLMAAQKARAARQDWLKKRPPMEGISSGG